MSNRHQHFGQIDGPRMHWLWSQSENTHFNMNFWNFLSLFLVNGCAFGGEAYLTSCSHMASDANVYRKS